MRGDRMEQEKRGPANEDGDADDKGIGVRREARSRRQKTTLSNALGPVVLRLGLRITDRVPLALLVALVFFLMTFASAAEDIIYEYDERDRLTKVMSNGTEVIYAYL